MRDLNARVAVITGAGSGIGRAVALSLARQGVKLVLAGLTPAKLEAVAGQVREIGSEVAILACDVSAADTFEQLKELAGARFGGVHIVMNNAGAVSCGRPEEIPLEEWVRVFDVNFMAVVRSNRTFLPLFLQQGEGHLVNTASVDGLFGFGYDRLPYAASKAALVQLSEGLALYLRPRGIGVTCLCPGPVATDIGSSMRFFSKDLDIHGAGAMFSMMESAGVGDIVVEAIRENRFLVATHPGEVHDILVRRAENPDAFVDAQIATPQILFRTGG
jgi:NAD(P)-dependent dehydrogenase (short-subunit alcohol dehydrogenase family)